MPQDATCPKCSHSFPVTEARGAYTVTCPRCEAELTAEFLKPAAPPEAGQPPYELKVKAGALPGAAPPPPPRKKKDEDDEPKRGGGSAAVVLLSGGLGLLFVLGGLSVTGWYLFTQVDVETTTTARNSSSGSRNSPGTPNNPRLSTPNPPRPSPTPPPFTRPNPTPAPGFPNPEPKKKDTFDLRPVPGTNPPLQPPNIDTTFVTEVKLDGTAGAVAVGGGGRYFVLHMQNTGKLVVFDVNTAKLLDVTADVGIGDVKLAAGATRLVATVGSGKKLRVFALPDLKPMGADFDSPLFHHVQALAMGSRTNGPVLAADPFGEVVLMDLSTGKPVEGSQQKLALRADEHVDLYRAAPDGKTFLLGDSFRGDAPARLLTEERNRWKLEATAVTSAYLGPDGRRLYGKDQIAETGGRTLATKPASVSGSAWYVPATSTTGGNIFLRVNETRIGGRPGVWLSAHKNANVDIPATRSWEGAAELAGLLGPGGVQQQLDQHLFLVPEAKVLVVIPRDRTKLMVRRITI